MTETCKIAAILAADVVGFSRMASADEDRTLARLRALRADLTRPARQISLCEAGGRRRTRNDGECDRVGSAKLGGGNNPPGGNLMKYLLLLIPCVVALWVPLFNSVGPELFGIPFFYWFQLLLVPVSALAIFAADRVGKA